MKPLHKLSLLVFSALVLATMPSNASDKPEQGKVKPKTEAGAVANSYRAIPFRGKLDSKTDSSITIGSRTFEITSGTRLMKAGKPAKLADAVVGEEVSGSYQDKDGKLIAKTVRFGSKSEGIGESMEDDRPRPPVKVAD